MALRHANDGGRWSAAAWPIVLAAVLLATGCIVFSDIHSHTSGDSVVPVLVSTVHWTPHYWGADRFGMVLPFLAAWINNPLTNLIAQNCMSAFLGLLAPFLLARFIFGPRLFVAVGGAVSGLYVFAFSPFELYTYISLGQCYAPAVGFGYAGLCFFTYRGRRLTTACFVLLGLVCLGFAFWMTPTMIFSLGPLIVLKRAFSLSDPDLSPPATKTWTRLRGLLAERSTLLLLAVLATFALSYLLTEQSQYHGRYTFIPVTEWPESGLKVLSGLILGHMGPLWAPASLAVAALLGLGLLIAPFKRATALWALKLVAVLGGAMFCEFAIVSLSAHVKLNAYDGRYLFITRNMLCVLATGLFFGGLYRRLGQGLRRAVSGLVLTFFLAAACVGYGPPSMTRLRAAVDKAAGSYSRAIVGRGCTHFIGDYWVVWPAVFHANLTYYEHGLDTRVWGVSERAQNTQHLWSEADFRGMRICGANNDASVESYLHDMGVLKPRKIQLDTIKVYLPTMPLLYGAAIESPQELSFFPEFGAKESILRPYLKEKTRISTLEFKGGGIYGYILENADSSERQIFLDQQNTGEFTPFSPDAPMNLGAYGFGSPSP